MKKYLILIFLGVLFLPLMTVAYTCTDWCNDNASDSCDESGSFCIDIMGHDAYQSCSCHIVGEDFCTAEIPPYPVECNDGEVCEDGVCEEGSIPPPSPTCGNGSLAPTEDCEKIGTNDFLFQPGDSCVNRGFDGGYLTCTGLCTVFTGNCTSEEDLCNPDGVDGIRDGDEECDGTDLAGLDCTNFGSEESDGLSCTDNCTFDDSDCDDGGGGGGSVTVTLDNILNTDSIKDLIDGLINFIFYLGLAVAPIMFIVGGFVFLTSSGDPTKVAKGKNIMLYTAIGLAIVIAAKGLILVLKDILGVKEEEPAAYFKNLWFFGILNKEFFAQKINIIKKYLKVGNN